MNMLRYAILACLCTVTGCANADTLTLENGTSIRIPEGVKVEEWAKQNIKKEQRAQILAACRSQRKEGKTITPKIKELCGYVYLH